VTEHRQLLARYLRQVAELGIDEVFLDRMSAREALDLLAGHGTAPPAAKAAATPAARAAETKAAATGAPAASPTGAVAPTGARAHAGAGAQPAAPPAATAAGRSLDVLSNAAAGCVLCRLHEGRTNVVFGEGAAAADVVVVGEAPGQEEDRTGRPFVGRAGRLLDLMLMTAGFPREQVYICNVLKCRPPGNRNPLPDEVAACTGSYLHAQIEAVAPRVVLAVGKFASQALLESEESIGRLRGAVHRWRGLPLIVTYHPAYLLRSPQMTRVAWQDFQLLRKVLDEQT
jgi:uracil-DNA glycosylase